MNDHDPFRPLDYIALAGLAVYGLAGAVGIVWMLIQAARLIHATGHADMICSAAILLLMVAIVVAAPRR